MASQVATSPYVRHLSALTLAALLAAPVWAQSRHADLVTVGSHRVAEVATAAATGATNTIEALANRDPLALIELAHERCERSVTDYSCTFTKQERVRGRLLESSRYEVKFREAPLSVFMVAEKPTSAKRVLFVENSHVDRRGRQQMLVEPTGLARLLISKTKIPIDDRRVLAKSRRTIDQFGFRTTLQRIIAVCRQADEAGILDLRFDGYGSIDGRPTYVLERRLPEGGSFANAKLVLHLDQEWLLPVAVYTYADHAGDRVIGRYNYTDISLNPGFSDASFRF